MNFGQVESQSIMKFLYAHIWSLTTADVRYLEWEGVATPKSPVCGVEQPKNLNKYTQPGRGVNDTADFEGPDYLHLS